MFFDADELYSFILNHCIVDIPPGEITDVIGSTLTQQENLDDLTTNNPIDFLEHCIKDINIVIHECGCLVNFLIKEDYGDIKEKVFQVIADKMNQYIVQKYNNLTQFCLTKKQITFGIYFWNKISKTYKYAVFESIKDIDTRMKINDIFLPEFQEIDDYTINFIKDDE